MVNHHQRTSGSLRQAGPWFQILRCVVARCNMGKRGTTNVWMRTKNAAETKLEPKFKLGLSLAKVVTELVMCSSASCRIRAFGDQKSVNQKQGLPSLFAIIN